MHLHRLPVLTLFFAFALNGSSGSRIYDNPLEGIDNAPSLGARVSPQSNVSDLQERKEDPHIRFEEDKKQALEVPLMPSTRPYDEINRTIKKSKSSLASQFAFFCCCLGLPLMGVSYLVGTRNNSHSEPSTTPQIIPQESICSYNAIKDDTHLITGKKWLMGSVDPASNHFLAKNITYCPTEITDAQMIQCLTHAYDSNAVCIANQRDQGLDCTPFTDPCTNAQKNRNAHLVDTLKKKINTKKAFSRSNMLQKKDAKKHR